MYCDIVGRPVTNYRPCKLSRNWIRWSADYKAAMNQIRNGELSWSEWLNSLRPPVVGPIWSLDDPGPAIFPFMKKVTKRFNRLIRKIVITSYSIHYTKLYDY